MISLRTSESRAHVEVRVVRAEAGQAAAGERRPEDAGVGHEPPLGRAEGIQACRDECLQRGGGPDGVEVDRDSVSGDVATAAGDHGITVDESPDGLHGEQRDALSPGDQGRAGWCGEALDQAVEQSPHRGIVQRVQPHHGGAPAAQVVPAREQLGTGEREDEHRALRGPHKVVQEVEQPLVGVVGVIDDEHDRGGVIRAGPGSHVLEERGPRREQVLPAEASTARAHQDRQPGAQPIPLGLVGDETLEGLIEFRSDHWPDITLDKPDPGPDRLGQRPERHAVAVGQTPAAMPPVECRTARRRTSRTPRPAATCPRQVRRRRPPAAGVRTPRWRGTAP